MKNHLTTEQLALYSELLMAKKLEKVPSKIANHIANCDKCAAEATELSFIIEDSSIYNTTSNKLKHVSLYKYIAIAASLILPIALWFSFNNLFKNTNFAEKPLHKINNTNFHNKTANTITTDSSINNFNPNNTITDNIQLAYTPHPETEKLFENFKGNLRSNDIKILSKNEIKISKSKQLLLEWENPENITLTVEIFDNNGINIESKSVSSNSYIVTSKFHNGLYYWKLFNEEFDLLFCGKIKIK